MTIQILTAGNLQKYFLLIALIALSPAIYQFIRTATVFLVWKFSKKQNHLEVEYHPNGNFKKVTLAKLGKKKI